MQCLCNICYPVLHLLRNLTILWHFFLQLEDDEVMHTVHCFARVNVRMRNPAWLLLSTGYNFSWVSWKIFDVLTHWTNFIKTQRLAVMLLCRSKLLMQLKFYIDICKRDSVLYSNERSVLPQTHVLVSDHKSDSTEIKRILFIQNASSNNSTSLFPLPCQRFGKQQQCGKINSCVKWVHRALGEMLRDPPAAHFLQWLNGVILRENYCNLRLFMWYHICIFAEMQWLQ